MNPRDQTAASPSAPTTGRSQLQFSPYRVFPRDEWARLRADTPMTLVPREVEQLSGIIEELAMAEVEEIFLPMSRLLNLHVAAAQNQVVRHAPPSCFHPAAGSASSPRRFVSPAASGIIAASTFSHSPPAAIGCRLRQARQARRQSAP